MNAVINLPQRFQDVDGNSPLGAGYRMIALMLCTPVASVLSSFLTSRKVPPLYILVFSAIIQLIGVTFMSLISTAEQSIRPAEYGLEILMGFGFGFNFNILLLMASTVVDKKDIGNYLSQRILLKLNGLAYNAQAWH
jgi:drug/metabolite transporter (DMT)-like permease